MYFSKLNSMWWKKIITIIIKINFIRIYSINLIIYIIFYMDEHEKNFTLNIFYIFFFLSVTRYQKAINQN